MGRKVNLEKIGFKLVYIYGANVVQDPNNSSFNYNASPFNKKWIQTLGMLRNIDNSIRMGACVIIQVVQFYLTCSDDES